MKKFFIAILILATVIIGVVEIKRGDLKITSPEPSAVATEVSTQSPTPSPSLSPTPSATPKASASASPTPSPSIQAVSGPPGAGLSTLNVTTQIGNFSATVLSLDLASTRIITDTANDSDCSNNCPVTNLQSYVTRNNGFAGVNGTYFCPAAYPECAGKTNSYDFPVYNTRLSHWLNQGNLFWNGRAMLYYDGGGAHYLQNANSFSGSLVAGIVNYPGLVDGGNVQIDDNQSGLSDKQKAVGLKVGIGIRSPNNVMVVIAPSVNMQQFAYVFKSLGATGALNLDTGGSAALFYNGRYIFGPGRDIPNAVIFASK